MERPHQCDWQFRVSAFWLTPEPRRDGLPISRDIKGLGPTCAQRVVEHFGLNPRIRISNRNGPQSQASGKTKQIMLHLKETEHRDILSTLRSMRLATISAVSCCAIPRTLAVIHQNLPIGTRVRGISFKRADTIALSLGIDPRSPLQIGPQCFISSKRQDHKAIATALFEIFPLTRTSVCCLSSIMLEDMLETPDSAPTENTKTALQGQPSEE